MRITAYLVIFLLFICGQALAQPGEKIDNTSIAGDAPSMELSHFEGKALDGKVALEWAPGPKMFNRGFEVKRMAEDGSWRDIGFVPGTGDVQQAGTYKFEDPSPESASKNIYRLAQTDRNGEVHYSQKIEVLVPPVSQLTLYPNPSDGNISVEVDCAKASLRLCLLGMDGRTIDCKEYSDATRIDYTITSPPGVYVCRIVIPGQSPEFVKVVKK